MIMLHGQDYLMTAILFGEILETLADIYREKK
jgi:cellobiose-specific phosphotransferase system component IIA